MRRMGFVSWNSYMSVLDNGSSTLNFEASCGHCRGDPLSSFLFLMAVEGLSGMVHNGTIL